MRRRQCAAESLAAESLAAERGLILSVNWNYGKPPKIHSDDQGNQPSPSDTGPS